MRIRFFRVIVAVLFLSLGQTASSYAQLSLTGPVCVMNGTEYQYDISKDQLDSSDMQLCVTGGWIAGTDSTCRNGSPFSFIRVVWTDTIQGSISLNTSQGNSFSISVNMTTNLQGGKIDSPVSFQTVMTDSIPSSITCSDATGGSCSPTYVYQWQSSANGMNWNDISGAVLQQLGFSAPPAQSTYYRRKVTETASGSENFSDVGAIITTATNNP